jgi:hypothetical protein
MMQIIEILFGGGAVWGGGGGGGGAEGEQISLLHFPTL